MDENALTTMQRSILRVFFDLPESEGFVIAGGAALVASGLSERPTDDVDLFGGDVSDGIVRAADALERACIEQGWTMRHCRACSRARRGIDLAVLIEMLNSIDRFTDAELVDLGADPPELRSFFASWRESLAGDNA